MPAFEQFGNIALVLQGAVGLASLVTWGFVIRGFLQGRLPLIPQRDSKVPADHWSVFAGFVAWTLADLIVYSMLGIAAGPPGLEQVQLMCLAGTLKIPLLWELLYAANGVRLIDLLSDRRSSAADLKAGVWGFFFSVLPVAGVIWLIAPLKTAENGHALIHVLQDDPAPLLVIWIGIAVCVIAPLFEELLFRVILQGWLQERVAPALAVILVAFVFATVHGHSWPDPLPLFPLAVVFGYLYHRRRSYLANVVMHSLFNGFNLMMALMPAGEAG